MKIRVTWGSGEGDTKKAAFDMALWDAGIANYNLIELSSVIPEGSDIVVGKADMNGRSHEHGHKLYVVLSCKYQESAGGNAVAGVGWMLTKSDYKKGLFVEITGEDEDKVRDDILKSLGAMASYRPEEYGEPAMKVTSSTCNGRISCSLVAAVYKSEGWGSSAASEAV